MAILYNNAAGGVLNGAVTAANSGGGSGIAWSSVDVMAGASFTFVNTASHGTLGYGLTSTEGNRVSFGWDGGAIPASMQQSMRAYIRLGTVPVIDQQLITAWASTQYVATLNLNPAGKLVLVQRAGGVLYTTTTTLAVNTWYRVEMSLEVGTTATNGVIRFAVFAGDASTPLETQFTSTTADLGTTNLVAWYFGKLLIGGAWNGFYDSIELNTSTSALLGPYNASAAVIRPASVVTNAGNWTNVGGASSLSAALADESDATYAQTPASPANAEITFGMNARLATGTPNVTVRLSASDSTPPTYADVALLQGTTVIATRNFGPLPTTVTEYSFTLTGPEAANVTDRGDLRVRVTGNQP